MAEITEARIKMQDGTEALYVAEAADMPRLPEWPFLAIHVEDLDAAREIMDVLERSRARKRTGKEPEAEAASKPGPGPLPPKCIAPDCAEEATRFVGFVKVPDLCGLHADVGLTIVEEWRRAQEKAQGRQRAQKIREIVEPGKVVAS